MAQTTVSIRMDNDLKNSFDHICNELGMSMSTAVTMLAKKMTREQRLPFELSVDPFLLRAESSPAAQVHCRDGSHRRHYSRGQP